MKKIFFLMITTVLLLLFAVPPDAPAPTGSRWDSSICSAVGINPDAEPKSGQIISTVTGQVTNPTKLGTAGLAVRKEDRIQMTGLGNDKWTIKNVRTEQSVMRWYAYSSVGAMSSKPLEK
jgi:hypothetical protein